MTIPNNEFDDLPSLIPIVQPSFFHINITTTSPAATMTYRQYSTFSFVIITPIQNTNTFNNTINTNNSNNRTNNN